MDKLVEELRTVMKDNGLTIAATTQYLDCSWISIQRWLRGKLVPSAISKRRIREGLIRIKKVFPEKESRLDLLKKTKEFYLKIENKLTEKEKEKVQESHLLKGPEFSLKMLQELEEKHRPDKKQIQMFQPADEKGEDKNE